MGSGLRRGALVWGEPGMPWRGARNLGRSQLADAAELWRPLETERVARPAGGRRARVWSAYRRPAAPASLFRISVVEMTFYAGNPATNPPKLRPLFARGRLKTRSEE